MPATVCSPYIINVLQSDKHLTHVSLQGLLDMDTVDEIEGRFTALIARRCSPTIVELSEVEFIDSHGLGMLVRSARYLKRHAKKMVLLRPRPTVRNAIRLAGVDKLIPIADEREYALESLL